MILVILFCEKCYHKYLSVYFKAYIISSAETVVKLYKLWSTWSFVSWSAPLNIHWYSNRGIIKFNFVTLKIIHTVGEYNPHSSELLTQMCQSRLSNGWVRWGMIILFSPLLNVVLKEQTWVHRNWYYPLGRNSWRVQSPVLRAFHLTMTLCQQLSLYAGSGILLAQDKYAYICIFMAIIKLVWMFREYIHHPSVVLTEL